MLKNVKSKINLCDKKIQIEKNTRVKLDDITIFMVIAGNRIDTLSCYKGTGVNSFFNY